MTGNRLPELLRAQVHIHGLADFEAPHPRRILNNYLVRLAGLEVLHRHLALRLINGDNLTTGNCRIRIWHGGQSQRASNWQSGLWCRSSPQCVLRK